jgi:hypothetical protein
VPTDKWQARRRPGEVPFAEPFPRRFLFFKTEKLRYERKAALALETVLRPSRPSEIKN